jgi:hypothetical protein
MKRTSPKKAKASGSWRLVGLVPDFTISSTMDEASYHEQQVKHLETYFSA